jgi:DNA end-binding protein Ku
MVGTRKAGNSRKTLTVMVGKLPLVMKYNAVSKETETGLHQFSPAGNPIKLKRIDGVTGEEVAFGDIVKGKEIGDKAVLFSKAELDGVSAKSEGTVSKVQVVDCPKLSPENVRERYFVQPQNQTFWDMVADRLKERSQALRFIWVGGNQEREAYLYFDGDVPTLVQMLFPSEVLEKPSVATNSNPQTAAGVDALLDILKATDIPMPEENRNRALDELVEAKLTGKEIPVFETPKTSKTQTAEDLLAESLILAKASA